MASYPNILNFSNDLIKLYKRFERTCGIQQLQNKLPKPLEYLISGVSVVAMGYFAYKNSDGALLGAGATAGCLISYSYLSPKWGGVSFKALDFPSLKGGPLLGMMKEHGFALQKVFLVAALLKKTYGLPTGFLMANALVHAIHEKVLKTK